MRAYYYLLFRLYHYFERYFDNQDKEVTILRVTATSTVIVYIGLFTIALYFDYYDYWDLIVIFPNIYFQIPIVVAMGLINYYFFVRHKYFLSINLKEGLKNDLFLITSILIGLISFVYIMEKDTAKMDKQKLQNAIIENVQTPNSEQSTR